MSKITNTRCTVAVGKASSARKPKPLPASLTVRVDGFALTQGELPFEPQVALVATEDERDRVALVYLGGEGLRAIVEQGALALAAARARDLVALDGDDLPAALLAERVHGQGDTLAAAALLDNVVTQLRADLVESDVDDLVEAARKIESYRALADKWRRDALAGLLFKPCGGGMLDTDTGASAELATDINETPAV